MLKEEILAAALRRIEERRRAARAEQERRTAEILEKIPEAAKLDRQLRKVCMSVFQAGSAENRQERLAAIRKQTDEAAVMLRQMLTACGYPADYLDIHYSCTKCNDSGYTDGRRCTCLEREIGLAAAEQLNRQSQLALSSFDAFSLDYYRDLPHEEAAQMEKIYRFCRQYAEHFSPQRAGSLLMIGATGLGKTHLSLAIASEVIARGFTVVYDAAGSLLHILEQEHFGRAEAGADTLSALLECDLLILDDFGTEFDTSFSRSVIYTILNGRINAGLPFIVNTNLSHEEMLERYGERIVSRLFAATVMRFCGRDIRLKKKAQHANPT